MDPEDARTIGRMEGKLDALQAALTEIKALVTDSHSDLDERLRVVEKRQWWLAGAAAVLTWIVTHFIDAKSFLSKIV